MATSETHNLADLSNEDKLKKLENIEVKLTVEAGSAKLSVKELIKLKVGSVVPLKTVAGEHLWIRANGTLVLRCEIVNIGGTLAMRITDVIYKDERSNDDR